MGLHLTTSLRRLMVVAFTLIAVLCCASSASAATYTVTSTSDTVSGDCTATTCSLRDATIAANATAADDVINIPAGTYTLSRPTAANTPDTPETGDLDIIGNGATTFNGESPRTTTIDATGLGDRVLQGQPPNGGGVTMTVNRLTITGGEPLANGGGILAVGIITITNSAIVDNEVRYDYVVDDGGYSGGGAYLIADTETDAVTVRNTTIAGNKTVGSAGGLGVFGIGDMTVENNTIANNTVDSTASATPMSIVGGGVFVVAQTNNNTPTFRFRHNTVTNNRLASNSNRDGVGTVGLVEPAVIKSVDNNIIAGNDVSGTGSGNAQCSSFFGGSSILFEDTDGVNLDDDSTCFSSADAIHADPQLGSLQNNGGLTDTVAIARTSPAFNAGTDVAGAPTVDQRGVTRPQLGGRDLGAVELTASADVAITGVASPQTVNTGDTVTFTYTVTNSGDPATGVKLTDNLPSGLSYVSGTATQGSCTPGISCELGTLISGASVTVSIVAKADVAGTYTNIAAVTATEDDPENTNNSVSLNTQVNTPDTGTTSPTEPTSTTLPVATVRQHSVQLMGAVDPKNSSTTVYFEYGVDRGYGSRTTNQTVSGTSAVKVGALIDGLQLGTVYHYRIVSVNATGTTYGVDRTFRTQGRLTPRQVSLKVTPRHDRRYPYSFTSTGKVNLPAGVTSADGCSGKVVVVVKRGKTTVSSRTATVRRDCTYKSSVAFKRYNARRSGKLTVQARFIGNKLLLRRSSVIVPIRFGR